MKNNFVTRMISLLVLLALITSASLIDGRRQEQLECPAITDCRCFEHNGLEIQCPYEQPNVIVIIEPDNNVQFTCYNMKNNEFEMLPNLTLKESNLQISGCDLPHKKPILTYLKSFQIEKIKALQFISNGNNSNIQIKPLHFEGMTEIKKIDLRGLEHEFKLANETFRDMKRLQRVKISIPNTRLPAGLFSSLDNLTELDLSSNKLKSVEAGLLRNQNKLTILRLSGNSLRNLSENIFEGLNLITELDLGLNQLEFLNPDIFHPLTSLVRINLSANRFFSLPEGLFEKNQHLKKFWMLENRVDLKTLPNNFLANLTELEFVSIKCGLQNIPENVFFGSSQITNISLQNNALENLPKDLFRDQINLVGLNLSGNAITEFRDDVFLKTQKLKELNLSKNILTNISNKLFDTLKSLEKLYLENNKIVKLESKAFGGLKAIKLIHLQNNFFDLHTSFQALENLQELNLSNNSITTVLEEFTLSSLAALDLSHNKITELTTTDLQSYNQKKVTINLSNNLITGFVLKPESRQIDFERQNLTVILENNPFVCDCEIYDLVEFVQRRTEKESSYKIHIGDLKCTKPEKLEGKLVKELNPWNLTCPLETSKCPEGCECEKRKDDGFLLLKCGSNINFDQLPVASKNKLNQTELRIENTNLTKLPENQSQGYQEVTNLFLSGNKISDIEDKNIPPFVKKLELNNNKFSTLKTSVIKFLNKSSTLEELKLAGNPWNCKCGNKIFILFAQKSKKIISDFHDMKCADGSPFNELNVGNICSKVNTIVIFISCLTALMGIILGVIFAFYYKYEKQIKIWLYARNLCLWFVSEEELDEGKPYDAFISYSERDNEFVADLKDHLEAMRYNLCIHQRDWIPGVEISAQISNSVNNAKRIIIVMSPNYLQSNWAKHEFRVAQAQAVTERRSRIIVILLRDIGDVEELEPDIRDYLKLNTYVRWGDNWFWDKLKYALPHCKDRMLARTESHELIAMNERPIAN